MLSNICLIYLVAALLLPFSAHARQGNYTYIVSGRAIDSKGQPVAGARVVLSTSESLVFMTEGYAVSDAHGRFRCRGITSEPTRKMVLYVTSPPPPQALFVIKPPFSQLSSVDQPFNGRTVYVNPDQELNMGDIPVQVQYSTVTVYLRGQEGNPLLTDAEEWWDVRIRVRDSRGDSVAEVGLSEAEISEKVDTSQSGIRVALPHGTWEIEVSPRGAEGPWFISKKPVVVGDLTTSLQITLKQQTGEEQTASGINNQCKSDRAEEAQRELERMGIKFTKSSFLERVNMLNAKAIALFLDAGMTPNLRDDDGRTPLISAAMQGDVEIVKMLINKGADVNAVENDGSTALMSAVTGRFATIVKILLAHGANVNAQHENGVTALLAAIGNSDTEIIKDLLAAGADVNLKTKSGRTALTDARATGNEEIIQLLERAGRKIN